MKLLDFLDNIFCYLLSVTLYRKDAINRRLSKSLFKQQDERDKLVIGIAKEIEASNRRDMREEKINDILE